MTGTWLWRPNPRGGIATCMQCGATLAGDPEAVARLEEQHDPDVCAARAKTPAAVRFRGGGR